MVTNVEGRGDGTVYVHFDRPVVAGLVDTSQIAIDLNTGTDAAIQIDANTVQIANASDNRGSSWVTSYLFYPGTPEQGGTTVVYATFRPDIFIVPTQAGGFTVDVEFIETWDFADAVASGFHVTGLPGTSILTHGAGLVRVSGVGSWPAGTSGLAYAILNTFVPNVVWNLPTGIIQ